jgi:hypothetical protein
VQGEVQQAEVLLQGEGQEEGDAFEELVRLAIAVDPSLAQQKKQAAPPTMTAASSLLGPPMGSLPNQSKPPWLRQRAPQGDRYKVGCSCNCKGCRP